MYLICAESRHGNKTIFLADRGKTKSKWWTLETLEAIIYKKKSAAEFALSRLHYNNPSIITYKQALQIEQEQTEYNEHPHSEDGVQGTFNFF